MLEQSFSSLSSLLVHKISVLQSWGNNSMRANQLDHKGSIQSLFKTLKVIILLGSAILNTPEPQISWGWRLESGLAWGWILELFWILPLQFKPSMGKSSCLFLSFRNEGLGFKKWFNLPLLWGMVIIHLFIEYSTNNFLECCFILQKP